ncbi:arsenic resistance protein [Nesterenkonia halophila]|uniref:arsenic resistance protein n=1 Tax=Nesterenkonia halophila TaxID=302044 RepID=UPI0012925693|nr:arsenic resistance protein [Nesterenkonia halophila]
MSDSAVPADSWMRRRQVPLYVAALVVGAVVGLAVPSLAVVAEVLVHPVLGVLLYATFLEVPAAAVGRAVRDRRFLAAALGVNLLLVPPVVWLLSRPVADDPAVLLGVLFVLLTPCVDYVVVFAGLAGGAQERLLAITPLLMIGQMALLPPALWLLAGPQALATLSPEPFLAAFVLLIVLPLAAAWITQAAARRTRPAAALEQAGSGAMVPLMMLTLATVVVSQIAAVADQLAALLQVIPLYVLFAAIMVVLGLAVGRLAGMDVAGRRAVIFSGATRNSLVVLPLVLALPDRFALAALVVVTQTLVELVLLVLMVRAVPRLVPQRLRGRG